MGVRLDEDEAWAAIEASHTGTVTTLRRDGWPISLPVWFVAFNRRIYLSTPSRSKKVARVRNDGRACFQVEGGLAWTELKAVVMPVEASLIEDEALIERIAAGIKAKYADFTTDRTKMPEKTREHYARSTSYIELRPTGRILSWDNARISLAGAR